MRIALFALALVWPSFAFAEVFTSVAAAKDVTDKIMAKVGAGDFEAGLKILRPYTVVPPGSSICYKTPQGWVINTFKFDYKIQELF